MSGFIKRILGATEEEDGSMPPEDALNPTTRPPLRFGLAYNSGQVRSNNEDTLLTFIGAHFGDNSLPGFGLFIVADGMGGHMHGEKASTAAAKTVAETLLGRIYSLMLREVEPSERPPIQEVLHTAVDAAHRAVSAIAPEGGTTLTVALIIGHQLTLAHVGDSRAYLIGPEGMEQATRDHSLVQRLQELGQLSAEEALVHPQRNILTRALGQGESPEADVTTFYMAPGTRLLLCSDGLWSLIADETILEIIESASGLQTACDRLVQAANAAGGSDNISVVLVEIAED